MLRIFTLFLLIGTAFNGLMAQNYPWRLRLDGGVANYYGDLSYQWTQDWQHYANLPADAQPWTAGLSLERRLSPTWGLSLAGEYTALVGTDRLRDWDGNLLTDNPNLARSLNFRSELYAANLLATFHLANGWLLRQDARLAPYLFLGGGYANFTVRGDLTDSNGNVYDYSADPERDQTYETRLDQLRTEEDGNYDTYAWQVPLGLGLDVRLGDRLRLGLRYQFVYTFSDYLDDVSGVYRQDFSGENEPLAQTASNPGDLSIGPETLRGDGGDTWREQDAYGQLTLSLAVELGRNRRKKYQAPFFYTAAPARGADTAEIISDLSPDSAVETIALANRDTLPVATDTMVEMATRGQRLPQAQGELLADTVSAPVAAADTVPQDSALATPKPVKDTTAVVVENAVGTTAQATPQTDSVVSPAADTLATKVVESKAASEEAPVEAEEPPTEKKPDTVLLQPDTVRMPAPARRDTLVIEQRSAPREEQAAPAEVIALQQELVEMRREQQAQFEQINRQLLAMQTRVEQGRLEAEQVKADQLLAEIQAIRQELREAQQQSNAAANTRSASPAAESSPDAATQAELRQLRGQMTRIEVQLAQLAGSDQKQPQGQADTSATDTTAAEASPAPTDSSANQAVADPDSSTLEFEYVPAEEPRPSQRPTRALTIERRDTVRMRDTLVLRDTVMLPPPPADTVFKEGQTVQKVVALPKASIFFAKGSTELYDADRATLDSIASSLLANPQLGVQLSGFADQSGNAEVNRRLSRERAERVSAFLQEKGIEEERIEIQYFGEERTRYNDGALDRRVEIEVSLRQ